MKRRPFSFSIRISLGVSLLTAAIGCSGPDPSASTPTSGRLIVFADETYAPLVEVLADSFMVKMDASTIEVRRGSARAMVQAFLDAQFVDSTSRDTGATTALVIGRGLLPDEEKAAQGLQDELKRYELAWDGIAVIVPAGTTIRYTMIDRLRKGLTSPTPPADILDSGSRIEPMRFLVTDQNSSTLPVLKGLLGLDSDIVAPARYFSTSDSAVKGAAMGEGVGLVSWFVAHRDSARLRMVAVGRIDSLGFVRNPSYVHPTTLVTESYPLKQPLMGFTMAPERSLAVGFLAWMSRSQDAQYYIARTGGLQPAVKMRLVLPE